MREVDRLLVGDRQRSRLAEADRAGVRVRRRAELELAAAEHLRLGQQLDVDLEADHRLVVHPYPASQSWSSSIPKKCPISCRTVVRTSSAVGLASRKTTTRWIPPTGS